MPPSLWLTVTVNMKGKDFLFIFQVLTNHWIVIICQWTTFLDLVVFKPFFATTSEHIIINTPSKLFYEFHAYMPKLLCKSPFVRLILQVQANAWQKGGELSGPANIKKFYQSAISGTEVREESVGPSWSNTGDVFVIT